MTPARTLVRLDRALSKMGAASRREADALIRAGRVTVAGRTVTDPATPVNPERDGLAVDGRAVVRRPWRLIALHKPRGVVTTRRDPDGRPTVFDLLGAEADGLVAVGRLDLASTGLLLLTTDSRLADWLTAPAHGVLRRYVVTARGTVTDAEAGRMEAGLEGLQAQQVAIRKRSRRESHLIIDLTEGRNREIRRLLAATGHEVTRLKRVAYGGLGLGELAPGAWRAVGRDEAQAAFPGAPLRHAG